KDFGIEIEEGMIILRREISVNGKSVCRVNSKLVTISTLREIGATLVDIHSQHEHQELMDESIHLHLLDQYGKVEIAPALKNYREVYVQYEQTAKKIKQLSENEQQMAHRLDLLQFQLQEIQQANLELNEDKLLADERRQLNNFEKIFAAIKSSYEGLQNEHSGLDYISHSMAHMEVAAEIDSSYQKLHDTIANCYYLLEDAASNLRNELDSLEYDTERLNEIEAHINEIKQLKRKYGSTVEEILEYSSKIEEEIEVLTNRDKSIGQLQSKLDSLKEDLQLEGKQLSQIRKKWAKKLTAAIHQELKELYMEKTIFEPKFLSNHENFTEFKLDGLDEIVFYISTNPGEPLKPLSKVASGGEISRIMLALKTIFSKHQG